VAEIPTFSGSGEKRLAEPNASAVYDLIARCLTLR